ncbi:DUF6415 family natural product biosynthesis protein [Streptomyces sp. NPDC051018]|uniref:DUF6415 family natural product biosynthesis protein n=1 Tax=Streptomyces sp. NPDC051018 TaxID=3365639 RepID=UPI0037B60CC8
MRDAARTDHNGPSAAPGPSGRPTVLALDAVRAATRRLLSEHAELPIAEELEDLTLRLRGHLMILIPEVERATAGLPLGDIPRACALAGVGEAKRVLASVARPGYTASIPHAQRIARSASALCHHIEHLTCPTATTPRPSGAPFGPAAPTSEDDADLGSSP